MENKNYPVTLYLTEPWQLYARSGDKKFHVFKNPDGKQVIFKKTIEDFLTLSEVFHSKALIMLGEPTAKNELATLDKGTGGIASEIFTKQNQHVEDFFKMNLLKDDKDYNKNALKYFQNVNLESFVTSKLDKHSPEFIEEFIRVWLTSNVFANTDTYRGHNIGAVKENETIKFMAPNYDFECCSMFLACPSNNSTLEWLQQGFTENNISYLKSHHKDTTNNYFERLIALKENPEFTSLCDFSGLEDFITENKFLYNDEQTQSATDRLSQLSEQVEKGYKQRFTMLSNQYSRGK